DSSTGLPRFFSFDGASTQLTSQPGVSGAVPMAGVAALDATQALAIDSSASWQTDGSSWTRQPATTDTFHDVAIASISGQTVEAIAAANPSSASGVVWHRTGT